MAIARLEHAVHQVDASDPSGKRPAEETTRQNDGHAVGEDDMTRYHGIAESWIATHAHDLRGVHHSNPKLATDQNCLVYQVQHVGATSSRLSERRKAC